MLSECACKGTGFITVESKDKVMHSADETFRFAFLLQKPCPIHNKTIERTKIAK